MGLLLVQLLVACLTSSYASSASEPWLDSRLPRTVSPAHYRLFLQPYINQRNFSGNVSIDVNVLNRTKFIIVHAENLNISSTKVFVNKTTSLKVIRAFPYHNNSYWVVETEEPMVAGVPVTLDMMFRGTLSIFAGLVKTGYINETTGDYSPMVMTVFKPNYARLAFPNFDEPYFKSWFTITLRHWFNLTAVSNMPQYNVTNIDSDWRDTTFSRSMLLSSFSVSFIISNFACRTVAAKDFSSRMEYRVCARPDRLDRVDYALNITPILQRFYSNELVTSRMLRKIDHFAVPFLPYRGGHASLGLISHNEEQLTFNSSRGDKQRLTNLALVAFELARTYFGNIITSEEWSDIWLESGLAAFYALKAAATIETMSFFEQLLEERALNDDAFLNSRPLVLPAQNPTEQPDVHHLLPVTKGAAVLKMMENFLGADAFNRGIRNYIRANSFKPVLTQDLFDAFQTVADASTNISEIMRTWCYSTGFPLITIRLLPDKRISATQKRFLMDPLANANHPPSTHGYTWFVPLNYRAEGGKTGRVWMNETNAVFDNLLDANDSWVIFNHDRSGFYRVSYERQLWDNITKQLESNHKVFTAPERAHVLSDALKLAQAEQLGFDVALSLTMYASNERSQLIWSHICHALENIHHLLSNTTEFGRYQRYVLNLTTNVMNELKVIDEGTVEQKLLRPKIMPLSCSAGHRGCIENATRLFKAWIQNDTLNAIPVNIRHSVYCSGIANSALESEWNTTFNRFVVKRDREEKDDLLLSLACTKNLTQLGRFLERCLSNNTADAKTLGFNYLSRASKKFSSNPAAADCIWKWLKVNRTQVDARFFPGASADLVPEVAYNFNTKAQLQEVQHFFASMNSPELVEKLKEKTEGRIKANIRRMNTQYPAVSSWLQRNFPNDENLAITC